MTQPAEPSGFAAPWILLAGILVGGGFLSLMLWDSLPRRSGKNQEASGPVIEFTEKNWQAEVVDSKVPVVVDFWAEWCGPCRELTPIIGSLAARYEGKVKVGKVDVDAAKELAARYQIDSIPCVMIFNGGPSPKKVLVGLRSEEDLAQNIDRVLQAN